MSVTGEWSPMIVIEAVGGGGEVGIAMGQVGRGLLKADLPHSQHRGPTRDEMVITYGEDVTRTVVTLSALRVSRIHIRRWRKSGG